MRNVPDKICREKQITHFIFNNFLPNILLFMRKCAKIFQSGTGHRRLYNMAHARCVQDNLNLQTHTQNM